MNEPYRWRIAPIAQVDDSGYSGTVTSADWGGGLLSTGDETDVAQRMEQAIRRYYAACNSGDVEAVAAFSPPALCITSRQATAARPGADELSVR